MGGRQHSIQGMVIASFNKENMGSYHIVKNINNNANVVDLPSWMDISNTFSVVDLTLFQPYMNLRYLEVT